MIEKPIGMRVYAVQETDESRIWLVGFGTYQGLKPIFGNLSPSNADWRKAERQLRKHDEKPIDVEAVLRAKRSYIMSDEQIRTQAHNYDAQHRLDKTLPMEERVRLHLLKKESKPCLHLDSGFIVWGSEVLWGPEERWERYRKGREVIDVPPPYDAKRWRDEETHDTGPRSGTTARRQADDPARATRATGKPEGAH